MSNFIDEAAVSVRSGRGGSGSATFHREKHVPRGGPNGADGGRGGSVVFVADKGVRTLLDFRYRRTLEAENGGDARNNKRGRDAVDLRVAVPVGTIVRAADGREIGDLEEDGQELVVARGGRGGRGNLHFTSSVRQAPGFAEKGEPGQELELRLELRLIASVGLVGLPNAGKSTLLAASSAARPKIADYPFTTIEPNLGVVTAGDRRFVMADLPGLIEGASEGHGLGHQFLRHVERTLVLVHVVDLFPVDGSDPMGNYRTVEAELAQYSPALADRRTVLALNKADLGPPEEAEARALPFRGLGKPVFVVSAATGLGLEALHREVLAQLEAAEEELAATPRALPAAKAEQPESWSVEACEDGFAIRGRKVERAVAMTDLANNEAVRYLHRKLERMGVIDALREAGVEEGDTVQVGDWEFTFWEGG